MLGATSGLKAAAGTIRGDFSSSRQMNLVHASDGPDAASREIALYFSDAGNPRLRAHAAPVAQSRTTNDEYRRRRSRMPSDE